MCVFIRGLTLPLHLTSEHLIAFGSSFSQVVDHVRTKEKESVETYRGGDNRPCHQLSVISILSKRKDTLGKGQLHM